MYQKTNKQFTHGCIWPRD